jgi:hypothetical protein
MEGIINYVKTSQLFWVAYLSVSSDPISLSVTNTVMSVLEIIFVGTVSPRIWTYFWLYNNKVKGKIIKFIW